LGKKEPSYITGGNANYYNHCGKQYGGFIKNLNVDLPYDPAISLLWICPKENDSGYSRGTCTYMLIVPLFTIAKLWKQPRCPATDEWIKKM
jgi:hypothetical protein